MTDRASEPKRPSIKAVAAAALAASERVLSKWLPDGKRRGPEWVALNPRRPDGKPGSFSVNTEKGAWADFATDDKGGDLVALVAYLDNVGQGAAAQRLAAFLGMDKPGTPATKAPPPKKAPGRHGELVLPVPDDAPAPPRAHHKHGKPGSVWAYRDAAARLLFYVARFDVADGKEVLPLSLWRKDGVVSWHWAGVPKPRPLYGLDRLAARGDALVVVCEGEKDTDAAGELLPDAVAVTSPNGSNSASAADWSALKGRRVVVWPDADGPGEKYAAQVVKRARKAGATVAAVLPLDALAKLHGGDLPAGWGAADALADGIKRAPLQDAIGACADKAETARKAGGKAAGSTGPGRFPFFLVAKGDASKLKPGVYYVPAFRDKKTGEEREGLPEWICSPLRVEAMTRDTVENGWGRLLSFPDPAGNEHRWAMPSSLTGKEGGELRELLLDQGLQITSANQSRRRLNEYIQDAEPGCFARCVPSTGWHGDAFVLVDKTIGPNDGELLVFQSAATHDSKIAQAGTLQDWRREVSAPCAGNARLVLALSAAFAAPCLHLAGLEGGGLHFRGPSSCGKSTAMALAASVYGAPDYRREWRATDNALESVAAMHSDTLLPLDEIGQLDPRHAAGVAYLLANGQGKSRSRRDGSLRAPATWRLLFLSCGEVGLGDLVTEAGGRYRAGMEVRVIDMPADAGQGLGVFDRVPEAGKPGAFADQLRQAAATHYGTAFPAFLDVLTGNTVELCRLLREASTALVRELVADDAAGQVRRVAQRLALIGTAGELATHHGITGWAKDEAEQAARSCFTAWLEARGGAGESEPRAMVRQVQWFIGMHSEGRFTPMDRADDDRAPKTLLRAGWRVEPGDGGLEHWVLPGVWRNEVCKGFDPDAVAKVLADRGLLKPRTDRGYKRRERVSGQGGGKVTVYRLLSGILDCEP